jgi:hypothetical protein
MPKATNKLESKTATIKMPSKYNDGMGFMNKKFEKNYYFFQPKVRSLPIVKEKLLVPQIPAASLIGLR